MKKLHPILDTKVLMIVAAYATNGFSLELIYYFFIAIFLDYLLRMLTAGLTFDYNGYPHNISEKKMNSLRWLSTVLVCLILTLYFNN
jgi:hypothetical protein